MDGEIQTLLRPKNAPWNKGRITGQKRPLKPKDVWAIRVRLQLEHRARDLALFNLAISGAADRLGRLGAPLNPQRQGLARATVLEDRRRILISYLGPEDLWVQ